jgi:hypothetical protein
MKKTNKKAQTIDSERNLLEFHEQASQLVTQLFQEFADEKEVDLELTFISYEDEDESQPESNDLLLSKSTVLKHV